MFWDADRFYYNNHLHEAGEFLRKQRERWHEIDFDGVGDYFSKRKESIEVIGCPKNVAQANTLSQILAKLDPKETVNSDTAVVLANEGLLFPVLNNLPYTVNKVNVTMGAPLKNTTLFSFIDIFFSMQLHAFQYDKQAFYYKDVISFLEHPYSLKIFSQTDLFKCKQNIIVDNLIFVSPKYLVAKV